MQSVICSLQSAVCKCQTPLSTWCIRIDRSFCGDGPFSSLKQVLINAFSDSSNALLVLDGYVMAVIKKSDFLYLFDITCTKFAGSF